MAKPPPSPWLTIGALPSPFSPSLAQAESNSIAAITVRWSKTSRLRTNTTGWQATISSTPGRSMPVTSRSMLMRSSPSAHPVPSSSARATKATDGWMPRECFSRESVPVPSTKCSANKASTPANPGLRNCPHRRRRRIPPACRRTHASPQLAHLHHLRLTLLNGELTTRSS